MKDGRSRLLQIAAVELRRHHHTTLRSMPVITAGGRALGATAGSHGPTQTAAAGSGPGVAKANDNRALHSTHVVVSASEQRGVSSEGVERTRDEHAEGVRSPKLPLSAPVPVSLSHAPGSGIFLPWEGGGARARNSNGQLAVKGGFHAWWQGCVSPQGGAMRA